MIIVGVVYKSLGVRQKRRNAVNTPAAPGHASRHALLVILDVGLEITLR